VAGDVLAVLLGEVEREVLRMVRQAADAAGERVACPLPPLFCRGQGLHRRHPQQAQPQYRQPVRLQALAEGHLRQPSQAPQTVNVAVLRR
jgi:hypothetical protein